MKARHISSREIGSAYGCRNNDDCDDNYYDILRYKSRCLQCLKCWQVIYFVFIISLMRFNLQLCLKICTN